MRNPAKLFLLGNNPQKLEHDLEQIQQSNRSTHPIRDPILSNFLIAKLKESCYFYHALNR